MSLVLSKYPNWLETLCSSEVALTLLGEDGCQVQVPAALLVAVSPLVKSMMADLLPPAYSPHVISIPTVTGAVLLLVAELLFKGTAVLQANNGEVQEVFKMMGIEAFLSYCVSDREVKDEDFTEDSCQFEIRVKREKSDEIKNSEYYEDFVSAIEVEKKKIECDLFSERNESSSDILLPPNENKDKEREKPFACDQCAYRAVRKGHLNQHMLLHTGEKPFACDQCDYRAKSNARLNEHIMLVHSRKKPFTCDQCDYRSVRGGDLKSHMLVHTGEKLFVCDQCNYKAHRHFLLVRHKALIHGIVLEKPFACDQCDYRAKSNARLNQHIMLVHSRKNPFTCDQCDYNGTSLINLNCHKANNHRTHKLKPSPSRVNEPLHCTHCGKLCKSKKRLEKHRERRHSGLATPREDEHVYCYCCGKQYKSKQRLEIHIQKRHLGMADLS